VYVVRRIARLVDMLTYIFFIAHILFWVWLVNFQCCRHFLLAGRGFDAEKLSREMSSIELNTSYEPLKPLGEPNIDGYLQHHRDMIVVTVIEEAKVHTSTPDHISLA